MAGSIILTYHRELLKRLICFKFLGHYTTPLTVKNGRPALLEQIQEKKIGTMSPATLDRFWTSGNVSEKFLDMLCKYLDAEYSWQRFIDDNPSPYSEIEPLSQLEDNLREKILGAIDRLLSNYKKFNDYLNRGNNDLEIEILLNHFDKQGNNFSEKDIDFIFNKMNIIKDEISKYVYHYDPLCEGTHIRLKPNSKVSNDNITASTINASMKWLKKRSYKRAINELLYQINHMKKNIKELQSTIALYSFVVAEILNQNGEYKKSLDYINVTLRHFREMLPASFIKAHSLCQLKKTEEASNIVEKIINQEPLFAPAYLLKFIVFFNRIEWAEYDISSLLKNVGKSIDVYKRWLECENNPRKTTWVHLCYKYIHYSGQSFNSDIFFSIISGSKFKKEEK